MKLTRTRSFALAISIAASTAAFGADAKKEKAPAPAKPAAPAKAVPAAPAEAKPAADAKPEAKADEVLAIVDGESIKSSEVDEVIRQGLAQQGMPLEAFPAERKAEAVRSIVNDMITDKIVKKASIETKVTDAEVDAELNQIRTKNNITDAQITQQLAAVGKTIATLKEEIRTGMRQRKWMDTQLADKVKDATEAEAQAFYDGNPQHFGKPEMVRASHILFMVKPDAKPEDATAALAKAKAATERAKKEDFAKLAGELSEEPGAKERGGDLNFFPREGMMVEEFSAAAYKLKKGEITPEPVRSQFGYHVIKATDKQEASKQPFAEAKEKITQHLTGQKKQEAAGKFIDELRAKSKVEIKLPPAPAPAPVLTPGAGAPPAATAVPPAPANTKPVEAVTPPVSVPAEAPKK